MQKCISLTGRLTPDSQYTLPVNPTGGVLPGNPFVFGMPSVPNFPVSIPVRSSVSIASAPHPNEVPHLGLTGTITRTVTVAPTVGAAAASSHDFSNVFGFQRGGPNRGSPSQPPNGGGNAGGGGGGDDDPNGGSRKGDAKRKKDKKH